MDRLFIRILPAVVLALVPVTALAQHHAHGSAWIHHDESMGTMVHAMGDSLCTISFPSACHNGMMGPDSLYCSWRTVPPDGMPVPMSRYCGVAVHCEIRDEYGQMMMPGHMTPHGLFRRSLALTMHYDPAVMTDRGMNLADLVLTAWIDGTPAVIAGAVHDQASSSFIYSTVQVAEWYGIGDRTLLPTAIEGSTWGQIKATYR